MSIENRNSVLFKRAEQLKRWHESDTNRECTTLKDHTRRIMFSDACVFLAACAAGDKDEVKRLLDKGVDIDTANIDGLTALHQACIDDNLDMVEFLVQHGADVNRGDNEGWTPLHATSNCGFLSIAKYLMDQGANVAAVNNDGDLPIDICETDEVGDMLQREIDLRGIDCDASRTEEEDMLLSDARQWLSAGQMMDLPHPKTGATGLHVAAAKGYIKAMHLLLKCGADINAQDFDGWTPLHAAAHWAQREACELLAESLCNMDIKNYADQTAFDVADADVLTVLEHLKNKQAMLQRERPEIEQILTRRPQPPLRRRSSVTRMSGLDKCSQVSRDASAERQRLQHGAIDEHSPAADADSPERRNNTSSSSSSSVPSVGGGGSVELPPAPAFTPPRPPDGSGIDPQSWRRPATGLRLPAQEEIRNNKLRDDAAETRRSASLAPPSPSHGPEPSVTATIIQSPPASPVSPAAPAPARSTPSVLDATQKSPPEPTHQCKLQVDQQPASAATSAAAKLSPATIFKNIFKSFVPPVRDEESETQRKAHAKRVRETRRSTQGVTLEELKSAEQYVKNQQQQQQQQQQKSTTASPEAVPGAPRDEPMERRPSWRLRLDESDKNKFSLEEVRAGGDASVRAAALPASPEPDTSVTLPLRRKTSATDTTATPAAAGTPGSRAAAPGALATQHDDRDEDKENDSRTAVATQAAIQRRRKPKRRSTGVVQYDVEENERKSAGKEGGGAADGPAALSGHPPAASDSSGRTSSRSNTVQNGELDYKKLYEDAMVENDRLQQRLADALADTRDTKLHLDKSLQMSNSRLAAAESDKREKRAIERKLSEMEEELKAMEELKTENRRLRDENGALIRVISKLSK